MSDKFSKVVDQAKEIKEQAKTLGKDAMKGAGALAGIVKLGVNTSKAAWEKASRLINKQAVGNGLETASKGVDIAAKGTKTIAGAMSAMSNEMKHLGGKLKTGSSQKKKTVNTTVKPS